MQPVEPDLSDGGRAAVALPSVRRTAPIILIGEAVSRLRGLLFIPLLTRYLQADAYGIWSQASVLTALVLPLIFLGSDSGVARLLPAMDRDGQRRAFTGWLTAVAGSSAVLAGVGLLARGPLSDVLFGASRRLTDVVVLTVVGTVVTAIVNATRVWFRIQHRAVAVTVVTCLQSTLSVLAVVGVLLTNRGVLALVGWTVAADAIVAALVIVHLATTRVLSRPDLRAVWPLIRFGLPLLPSAYALWGLNWVDRLLLVRDRGLSEVGVYALSYAIAYFLVQMVTNPVWLFFPYASAQLHDTGQGAHLRGLSRRSMSLMLFGVLPLVALTIPLGRPLLQSISATPYVAGARVIPIVMLGYLVLMLNAHYEVALGLVHRQWLTTVAVVTGLGVNTAANLLLIPHHGMIGAAWATLLGFSAQAAITVAAARREQLVDVDVSLAVRAAVAAVAAAVGAAATGLAISSARIELVVGGLAGMLVYAASCVAARAVPADLLPRRFARIAR